MITPTTRISTHDLDRLKSIVGEEYAYSDAAARAIYSRTVNPLEFKRFQMGDYSHAPDAIVQPASIQEIQQILAYANQTGTPLVPYGGGSGIAEGTSLGGSLIIDLKRFDQVSVNSTNRTVTAGAGVIGRHLEEILNQQGFTCGHFPQSMNSATIGGYVATAAIGTFSGRYGKMEDILVGLEAVLPNGEILHVKPIPRRSVGPHLEGLMIGSEGAFGIVTQATLKIFPLPEKRQWLCCTFAGTPAGLQAIRHLIQEDVRPALVRLYDEAEAAARIKKFGLPHNHALLFLAFEGPAGLVAWQAARAGEILAENGATFQAVDVALDWYHYRFDTSGMLRFNQKPGSMGDSLEIAAPWEDIETLWRTARAALEPLSQAVHVHFSHIYDNECSAYVIFYADSGPNTPQAGSELYQQCLKATMEACLAAGGTISHHHGVGRTKSAWMKMEHGEGGWDLLVELKHALDPNHILNPGALGIEK
jgi:alkyldihydroxyacetonephosphate synthase